MSLASLLFTEYRRKVLGLLLLHPDQRYHLREIARLTETQPGTLARELSRLADAGVLLRERVGHQLLYAANRQCPIFNELASILRKTSGLAEVLAEALQPLAERIEVAFVFGSMASGTARANSDIDLMVIGEAGFAELVGALYPLQEQLGREINPKVYTRPEWQALVAGQGAFVREVLDRPRLFCLGSDADLHGLERQG
jgi:predicted nucleotidyltransferase